MAQIVYLQRMSCLRVYVHAVWGVKYRDAVLTREMYPCIVDTMHAQLVSRGHLPIISNGVEDHIHSLFRFNCREDIGLTMKAIKGTSSENLNVAFFRDVAPFRWQGGYGVFSVSKKCLDETEDYIHRQVAIHAHRKLLFTKEYDTYIQEEDWDEDETVPYVMDLADR